MDQDCDSSTACINGQCSDPCKGTVDCGNHAVCQTAAHRPVCLCPKGYQRSSTGQGKLELKWDKLKWDIFNASLFLHPFKDIKLFYFTSLNDPTKQNAYFMAGNALNFKPWI